MILNYVTSKALSQKLWEAGIKKETIFWWTDLSDDGSEFSLTTKNLSQKGIYWYKKEFIGDWGSHKIDKNDFPAYLTDEILEMLEVPPDKYIFSKTIGGKWRIDFGDQEMIVADTHVDCLAKLLLYLLNNKIIKVEEIKNED